jgi:hypothetical protein
MTQGFGSIQLGELTFLATGRTVANFAFRHMTTAALMRDHTVSLERQHSGQELGAFFEAISSYASACIMTSVASLEALINELFIAHGGQLRSKLTNFDDEFWDHTNPDGKRVRGIEGKPILEKYQRALTLLDVPPPAKSTSAHSNAATLIKLRNALTHHKPLWDQPSQRHVDLETSLTGKFALSPFITSDGEFIAQKCMSAGCATWCVAAAAEFISEFASQSHLEQEKLDQIISASKQTCTTRPPPV